MLNSQDLLVGFLNPTISGGGLQGSDSVTFEIERNGVTVFNETFTNNAAYLSFFQDNVIDLGIENVGLAGANLNLEFVFDFSSNATGAGLSAGLAFGNQVIATPEPPSMALLAIGVLGVLSHLALMRVHRTHHR